MNITWIDLLVVGHTVGIHNFLVSMGELVSFEVSRWDFVGVDDTENRWHQSIGALLQC